MTLTTVHSGGRAIPTDTVTPAAQASVDAVTVVTGSEIDARPWRSLAYTIKVATNTIAWTVWGANAADYSDEVTVLSSAPVVAGAASSYTASPPPFAYYRVKIASNVGGVHGTATVRGIAKG